MHPLTHETHSHPRLLVVTDGGGVGTGLERQRSIGELVRSTSCASQSASVREGGGRCVCFSFRGARVCVCARARARGGGLRLPGSGCGFSPIFAPVSRTSPRLAGKAAPPPPRYPCFALADLIRDSALNLVRYTAVCMPRLALPATSATHTLSSPSAPPSRAYYLPSAHAHAPTRMQTRTHGQPVRILDSLVSCFHPARPRSLASDRYMPPLTLFLFPPSLSLSLTLSTPYSRALSLAFSLRFSLHPPSSCLSLRLFLYPLRHSLYPREQPPPP